MKNFINRLTPRLLRYGLLLKGILEETPADKADYQQIPEAVDLIKSLNKETEPGVFAAKQEVGFWQCNSNLVFKTGKTVDMDLLNPNRSLIHSGKLLRQPESGLEWNGWSELFVLLFDNYMVMTKPKDRDGVTKYQVDRRPVPLDLLTLVNFTEAPTRRSNGVLRGLRGKRHADSPSGPGVSPDTPGDSRSVYPLTLHHNGRTGGPYILYAESAQARLEWKQKLDEALVLRKVVQESNKAFEPQTLSAETFLIPSMTVNTAPPGWNQDNTFTGKVACSVPFTAMPNGRPHVAIGCAEGVWIGYQHDPKSMQRVLYLKMVTQCAILEEFGVFIVLADKVSDTVVTNSLFAYHIEALVPIHPQNPHGQIAHVPQKLNGNKDVHFFSLGTYRGRTLIIYMKKKGLESIFRILEPVGDKINEKVKAPVGFDPRTGFHSMKSEWFRVCRDFFLPTESFDLVFLQARIVVLCAKGFEILDLDDFVSTTVPSLKDPRMPLAKRCESARPMGMFRSKENEFLLCYDKFGLYVNKHGEPSRQGGTVEWEGTAKRVALHTPYVMIFDTRFIEIRDLVTGRLVQIIPGNDVRCIWDGRGVSTNVTATPADHIIQEAQVHAVMNAADSPGAPRSKPVDVVLSNTDPHFLDMSSTNPHLSRNLDQRLAYYSHLGQIPEREPTVPTGARFWPYDLNLVFKECELIDTDLMNPNRTLIHYGRLLESPEKQSRWGEVFVLLFDNYNSLTQTRTQVVVAKLKLTHGVKYPVNRPIPLDLLTLVDFAGPPTQKRTGVLRSLRGHAESPSGFDFSLDASSDSRFVYPLTFNHNGHAGESYTLYTDSAQARMEWKQKLDDALILRKVAQESNKAFEPRILSADLFLFSAKGSTTSPGWNYDGDVTGKVACSICFTTLDDRRFMAVGCVEGVWIGLQHDPKSIRRVLHLKMVTQLAFLKDFGIFIVLADKVLDILCMAAIDTDMQTQSLFVYHIEAVIPTRPQHTQNNAARVPQKLNGERDVQFFSVGTVNDRTLVIYMQKSGSASILRAVEPIQGNINEALDGRVSSFGSRFGFRSRSEWFRVYRESFIPTMNAFDVNFVKAQIVILCTKGFEIMNLNDTTVPSFGDPQTTLAKRCKSARPTGMFRSKQDEFLLCYEDFGLYVNKHGEPMRQGRAVEWEGSALHVALHAPYVLIIGARFIEIRELATGRLIQIIPGNDIQCIWDGRGVIPSATSIPAGQNIQEAQVHVTMNATASFGVHVITQSVAELVPTVLFTSQGSSPERTPMET
ncbi:hypothetical protein DXG01_000799 [Tephrocybe rancida]|nr:hypothetical protein DXG01_000799 [Tephrocybe rancida]